MLKKKMVIGVYSHPEHYPPTINAVLNLATVTDKISIVTRNNIKGNFPFPANVELIANGKYLPSKEIINKSTLWKFGSFFSFTFTLLLQIRRNRPDWLILYDHIPLLAAHLIRVFIPNKTKCWYHNHDVPDIKLFRKYSVGWFAAKWQDKAMKKCKVFSLPSAERKQYFTIHPKTSFFLIPNYPSLKFYRAFYKTKSIGEGVYLIFQGAIGQGHGLEEIIRILPEPLLGKKLHLCLKGVISADYEEHLRKLAKEVNAEDRLHFFGLTPYKEVPLVASRCDIGIGIHTGTDIMNKTLGTSSNKIYEYAALGLPVLLYDNEQFRTHLAKYQWAFFTNCSPSSLKNAIASIIKNYAVLSEAAHKEFIKELNFENNFSKVLNYIDK